MLNENKKYFRPCQTGRTGGGAGLDSALENMLRRTKDLRRQLRKAVVRYLIFLITNVGEGMYMHVSQVDHVSDNFLAHVSPLDLLVEGAGRSDEAAVSLYAEVGGNN